MDVYKNPDEVIQEVENKEARREWETDIKQEIDESPEDDETDSDNDKD